MSCSFSALLDMIVISPKISVWIHVKAHETHWNFYQQSLLKPVLELWPESADHSTVPQDYSCSHLNSMRLWQIWQTQDTLHVYFYPSGIDFPCLVRMSSFPYESPYPLLQPLRFFLSDAHEGVVQVCTQLLTLWSHHDSTLQNTLQLCMTRKKDIYHILFS